MCKNNKIGSEIITYNPDIQILNRNLKSISSQVDIVVIIDNGSENIKEIKLLLNKYNNIILKELNENKGIAYAQNFGMKILKDSSNWVMVLDQDSVIPKKTIEYFKNTKQFNDENTGIIALKFGKEYKDDVNDGELSLKEVKQVIASGNLVNVKAWHKVGGFDDWMFIDTVDFDFDARIRLYGYKIWESANLIMKHQIGDSINKKFLINLLRLNPLYDHSPFREYYIARNHLVYAKRYPMLCKYNIYIYVIAAILRTRAIPLYSSPRIKKFKAMIRGTIDGIKYDPNKDVEFQREIKGIKNKY